MENTASSDGWKLLRYAAIDPLAERWDRLVPRDVPHLRAGFLRAVERGRMLGNLNYLWIERDDRPAACAVVFTLAQDTLAAAPEPVRRAAAVVRRVLPRFLFKPLRICGSPISNAESGIYIAPELSADERKQVLYRIVDEVLDSGGRKPTYFFKEFDQQAVESYAGELERFGFFPNDPWDGTRLDLPWKTFDDYLAAFRKKYRKRIRQELKLAEQIEFTLETPSAALAATAFRLYANVLTRATFALEKGTEAFFAALSDFDQAKLLIARRRESGEVLGVNLLLFGDTCMHNLYIGFDYERNDEFHIYFNLVIESLRRAIDAGCSVCYLGQDSYEFKARLGAKPYPLAAYMMHRVGWIHRMLEKRRHDLFPPNKAASHDVFQTSPSGGDDD
jgi:hypothetical protein